MQLTLRSKKGTQIYLPSAKIFRLENPCGKEFKNVRGVDLSESSGHVAMSRMASLGANPSDELLRRGFIAAYSEQDDLCLVLSDAHVYQPRNEVMVRFAEGQSRDGSWIPAWRDQAAPTRSFASILDAARRSDGIASGSCSHERVALSQRSGTTDSPSLVTARQTFPPTKQGSSITSSGDFPAISLPLPIGGDHPVTSSLVYHYTDDPKLLKATVEKSVPFADNLLKKITEQIPGAEYRDLLHPAGADLKEDDSAYSAKVPSSHRGLLSARIMLDNEAQMPDAIAAINRLASVPITLENRHPMGDAPVHEANIPLHTGVSLNVTIAPKELREALDGHKKIAGSVKDWSLPDIKAAQHKMEDALHEATQRHRGRIYAGSHMTLSEAPSTSIFAYAPVGRVIDMQAPMPGDVTDYDGSPDRFVVERGQAEFVRLAERKGYTAMQTVDGSGFRVIVPLNGTYKATNERMVRFAEKEKMKPVDNHGRFSGSVPITTSTRPQKRLRL